MNFRDVVPPKKSRLLLLKIRIQEWLGEKSWKWLSLRLIWGQIEGFDLGCFTMRYQFYALTFWRLGWVEEDHTLCGGELRRSWVLFMSSGAVDEFFEGLCK